jgi:glycosyltransferase involved in cell wall biosynthesis
MDELDAPARPFAMTNSRLRVGLDLDGSLESLGDSMTDLADALTELGECDLVRFRTLSSRHNANESRIAFRALWSPLWRRSRGPSLDDLLPPVDLVHVAGLATPSIKKTPLIISVDDLRPLREESRIHQRIAQLQRAAQHGATLVASTVTASHEVQQVLGVKRSQVVVVPPAVPSVALTCEGKDLVVNVTGLAEWFLSLAPELIQFTQSRGVQLVALTSAEVAQRIRQSGLDVTVRARSEARSALAQARVVMHFSDGARFPSFAIAALAAGVPTMARSTAINRELLEGAAALVGSDDEVKMVLEEVWDSDARRAIMIAAGKSRAIDFAPATAARAYAALYRDVVRG